VRTLVAALVLGLIASVAASTWLWQELRAERRLTAELEMRRQFPVDPRAEVGPASAHGQRPPPIEAATTAPPVARDPAQGPSQEPGARGPDIQTLAAERQRLMADPQYRLAARNERRAHYLPQREDLVRALAITSAQADRIIDYWAARDLIQEQVGLSTAAAANWQQIQAINERAAGETLDEERALRDAVGEAVVERLREYEASRWSRMKVDALRARAGKSGEALRAEQIEPLVALVHAEQQRADAELGRFNATLDWKDGVAPDTVLEVERRRLALAEDRDRRILREAAGLLSAAQIAQLEALLAEQIAAARARVQMLEARLAVPRDAPTTAKSD
jgi:hypothetical protein